MEMNERVGYDEITCKVIRNRFGELHKAIMYLFDLSLQTGVFLGFLKIVKITPSPKTDDPDVGNYWQISVLLCFSKTFEKLMYNCVYKYLTGNNLLYRNRFDFQSGRSTDHAIDQLDNQVIF